MFVGYVLFLLTYMIAFSVADLLSNKHYIRKWFDMSVDEKLNLVFLLLYHNLVYPYLYFTLFFLLNGSIKNKPFIAAYFVVCTGVLLHWLTNDNKCFLTEMQNDVMDVEGVGFRDGYNVITNTYSENKPNSLRSNMYYAAIVTNIAFSAYFLVSKQ